MFTGSTATGREVAARAARSLTPCSLELGGKDALIVLEGAPLERAANVAVFYGMLNGGQSCVSIERVYVAASIHDEFLAKVTAKVAALRVGAPGGRRRSTSARSPREEQLGDHRVPRRRRAREGRPRGGRAAGARAGAGALL